MRYHGAIYRPPSEANSLIVQVTYGCSHNACTFCAMYRDKAFAIRPIEEILDDITSYPHPLAVSRVFLADGNALCLSIEHLQHIMHALERSFPNLQRVGVYATAKDVSTKSVEELLLLKKKKLGIVYIGVESGSDDVLKRVNKNSTAAQVIAASAKVKQAGILLSEMILSGLGGQRFFEEHALASADLVNATQPDYLALLTLMIYPETALAQQVTQGSFKLLTPRQVIEESQLFLERLQLENTVFRANHNSNYVMLSGLLNRDKALLLTQLNQIDLAELTGRDHFRSY